MSVMESTLEFTQMLVKILFNSALAAVGVGIWFLIMWGIRAKWQDWRRYSKHPAAVRLRRFKNARRKAKRERRACA
jgi:pyruvate/oxaloacetate carboxyltransferase